VIVYLVKRFWYDEVDLEKIFDSEEKALKYLASQLSKKSSFIIEERIVE
jgi:hypothetical protein